jgi:tetraacyldisaccharide 4'-kinase
MREPRRASLTREQRAVARVWFGDQFGERLARLSLLPLELVYGAVITARNALYDRGLLEVHDTALPSVSVGNLTVGGTGKTPVSAWLAAELASRGARPALVLRGYGDDEPLVHERLNPNVPVIVSSDRVAGAERARAEHGATVAVLDDAFQHRRARRDADVVLLSADRWTGARRHLLPAGPWRESLRALRRASLIVVTRKAATPARAEDALQAALEVAPGVPSAVVHLAPGALQRVTPGGDSTSQPLDALRGASVFAVSAIGDAAAFHAQLREAGALLAPPPATYPDHHAFTRADAEQLARDGERAQLVVCTLKDAVKLAALWPRAGAPLWYVSQRVVPERGRESVDRLVSRLAELAAARDRRADPLATPA